MEVRQSSLTSAGGGDNIWVRWSVGSCRVTSSLPLILLCSCSSAPPVLLLVSSQFLSEMLSVCINESSPLPSLPPSSWTPLSLNVFLGLGSHLLTSDSGFKFLTNLSHFYFFFFIKCNGTLCRQLVNILFKIISEHSYDGKQDIIFLLVGGASVFFVPKINSY